MNSKIMRCLFILFCFSILTIGFKVKADESFTSMEYTSNCDGAYSTDSGTSQMVCKLTDSVGNSVFCLEIGLNFTGGVTYTNINGETIEGRGMACGILDAIDAGNISMPSNLSATTLYINTIDRDNHLEVQRYLWKKQSSNQACVISNTTSSTTTNTGSLSVSPKNISLTREKGSLYYTGKITVNHSGLKGDKYTITNNSSKVILSTTDGGANIANNSSLSSNTLYVRIAASDLEKNDSFKVLVNGSYTNTTTTTTTNTIPVIQVFYKVNYASTDQRLGRIGLKKTTNTSQSTTDTPLKDEVTFSVRPWGSLIITKKNTENNKVVPGATFKLVDSNGDPVKDINGNIIEEQVTDSKGTLTFDYIPYGTYTLVETKSAEGYIKEDITIKGITIDKVTVSKVVTNKPVKTVISKKDITNEKELAGAHLVIQSSDGEVIHEFDSTEDPYEFYLGPGKYKMIETAAPAGFDKLETVFEFEILNNGDVKLLSARSDNFKSSKNEITIYNQPTIVPVPDTFRKDNAMLVSGLMLAIIGAGLFANKILKIKASNNI